MKEVWVGHTSVLQVDFILTTSGFVPLEEVKILKLKLPRVKNLYIDTPTTTQQTFNHYLL